MSSQQSPVEPHVAAFIETVGSWPHVTVGDHERGGVEFLVGSREIGHVHPGGTLDISFTRALRDVLLESGLVELHHVVPTSTWTTFNIESDDDHEHARWLLRLSYLHHVRAKQNREPDYRDVDVDAELDALEPSDAIRDAFGHR